MDKNAKIYVAGHRGLVGSAIVRRLRAGGCANILTRTHAELDLTDQAAVRAFFAAERPEYVLVAAAKVGGIHANDTYPVEFLRDNLLIEANVIGSAHETGVRKLLFLGSTCIYPRQCPQPMKEEYMLTGPFEPTNEWYAVAKVAGIKLCQAYRRQYGMSAISLMPTNLYGINDNFDLENSHVLPALMRRFHQAKLDGAKSVTLWGTGAALREFMHVDDLAAACAFCMDNYDGADILNVGTGQEHSIKELAEIMAEVVGFGGELRWDSSKPDGMPRKLIDSSRIHALGWKPSIPLKQGLADVYAWFLAEVAPGLASGDQ